MTDRLPRWLASFYDYLPFVPSSHVIRAILFQLEEVKGQSILRLAIWGILGFSLSLAILSKRN